MVGCEAHCDITSWRSLFTFAGLWKPGSESHDEEPSQCYNGFVTQNTENVSQKKPPQSVRGVNRDGTDPRTSIGTGPILAKHGGSDIRGKILDIGSCIEIGIGFGNVYVQRDLAFFFSFVRIYIIISSLLSPE